MDGMRFEVTIEIPAATPRPAPASDAQKRLQYVYAELGTNRYERRHLRAVLSQCGCAPETPEGFSNIGDCPRCRE